MKIVTATKFYYPRGGLESYLFKIIETLKKHGHKVIPFSTKYKENIKSYYEVLFPEYLDISGVTPFDFHKKLLSVPKIMYNWEARKKMSKLLEITKPDILWGFGVHRHLSPSIFMEAKAKGIPVIHRLSDYAIICPNSRLTKGDNSNCDGLLCPLEGYHNAIKNKCIRQSGNNDNPSFASSVVGALEGYLHNKYKAYVNNVDRFIAPSNFLKQLMIKCGVDESKISYIPIFIDPDKYNPEFVSQAYFVYVGRLSHEKGLEMLLEAMSGLKHHKLLIIGDGPQKEDLERIKEQKNLINVKFMGKLVGEQLKRIVRNSRFVIVPSLWYENSPHVILEAFALGKPVLGAKIGGIPEYIEPNLDGMLFNHDNLDELIEKIDFLMEQQTLCEEMGRSARQKVEVVYNPEVHYSDLMRVIKKLV